MSIASLVCRCLFMLVASSLLAAAAAHAESVYRCRGADGALAYQDRPCAKAQGQTQVELAPVPPSAPSPDYGAPAARTRTSADGRRAASPRRAASAPSSFECRATNGEVFYRHSACPKSIATRGEGGRRRGGGANLVPVSATPLTRSEACKRIGGAGRSGRERDERVSTYERNAGRDPCRRY